MGLHRHLNKLSNFGEESGVIPFGQISDSCKIERHVLEGAVPHLPGLFGVFEVCLIQFETETAAFRDFCCLPAVEDEVGIPLLGSDITDVIKKIHVARGFKKFLCNMNQRFWEEERPSGPISFLIDVKERLGKALGFHPIITIGLSCKLPTRSDGRHIFKMFGDLPIKIQVSEDGLSTSGDRLLGEFEDHHLSQLFQFFVRHSYQVGRKKKIDRIPTNRSGEMTLKGRGKFNTTGEKHLWMFCRLGHCNRVGKAQAKSFDVFEGLTATVWPIDKTQIGGKEFSTMI